MSFTQMSCQELITQLSSKAPVPGGGGASALVGALGLALGNMVASLTLGKAAYADVQAEMLELKGRADQLQAQLLAQMDKDAEAFLPLAQAYALPKDTEQQRAHKAQVMEAALEQACSVPLQIMRLCGEAIVMMKTFADKGSTMAISDAGVGALLCEAALQAASLNVFVNTKYMQNRDLALTLNRKVSVMMIEYLPISREIHADVASRLIQGA